MDKVGILHLPNCYDFFEYCEWNFTNITLLFLYVENITGKGNFYMDLLLYMQAFMRSTNGGLA
jgi:hypothetical protein